MRGSNLCLIGVSEPESREKEEEMMSENEDKSFNFSRVMKIRDFRVKKFPVFQMIHKNESTLKNNGNIY